ncbi:palmitoyltransferase ZDHHC3-like [Corticium candelabrum]|uniref:palmitoyltransferase ZDHHC3-like n=1 Tax=Corticium candelabrum TaxID=121492 RepID=UPI002E26F7EC|nr:palmitoyltransferase ZDHHC3-like [Corticium candelabrum]
MGFVFRNDPCGVACVVVTFLLVLYADFVVVKVLVPSYETSSWSTVHSLVFNIIVVLIIISHVRAVLGDPGQVPLASTKLDFSEVRLGGQSKDDSSDDSLVKTSWTLCSKCETYRPPRAHHCRTCRRCIRKMDHHCPWINNCVGEFNQKYFLLFLLYTGVGCAYAFILTIACWITQFGHKQVDSSSSIVCSMFLIIECVLFFLFVILIGCDQIQGIFEDSTQVEQVQRKMPHRSPKSKMALLTEVFGRGRKCLWLLPVAPRLSNSTSSHHWDA